MKNLRAFAAFVFLLCFTAAAWPQTFDYAPPPLGSTAKVMRDDLALELTGIDGDKQDADADLTLLGAGSYTDPNLDQFVWWDDSQGRFEFATISDLATEAAPAAGDYITIYGAEGDVRKVDWSSLPGAGGGISNVVEDTSPTLGGNLEGNAFSLGTTGSQASDVFLEEGGVINWDAGDCTLTQTGNSAAFGGCTLTGASVAAGDESGQGALELATTGEAETGTDTARAVTPAGLLAAFSGQKTISIPGGALIPATTAGCTAATLESTTNKIVQKICGFTSTSADEFGWFQIAMPKSWNEGTITGQFFWTAASGSGDVVWSLACLARSDDDAIDTALGTAITVTDTLTATGDLMISAATSAVTVGGTPAEGDEIFCRVARVGTNGSDTFSGTAQLSAVKVLYSINAPTDD